MNPGDNGGAARLSRPAEGRAPPPVIRARAERDLGQCVALLAEAHRRDGYPMTWPDDPAGWLAKPGLLGAWVATLDGRIVGHAGLSRADDDDAAAALFGNRAAVVNRLFVAPAARGHGTGAALLDHVVREARRRGLNPVLEALSTAPAVAFYERLGWRPLGSLNRQWGPNRVVVRCYAAPT